MKLRTLIKKAVFGRKILKKRIAATMGARKAPVKIFKLEDLKISQPRSAEKIKSAYCEGHFAEMTPHQAGI